MMTYHKRMQYYKEVEGRERVLSVYFVDMPVSSKRDRLAFAV